MRSLTVNEMTKVNGAGYAEDITATAATLYVGSYIGGFAAGFTSAAGTTIGSMVGGMGCLAPLSYAVGMITAVLTPTMYFAAPLMVGAAVLQANPGMQDALVDKYNSYFGA